MLDKVVEAVASPTSAGIPISDHRGQAGGNLIDRGAQLKFGDSLISAAAPDTDPASSLLGVAVAGGNREKSGVGAEFFRRAHIRKLGEFSVRSPLGDVVALTAKG